MRDFDEFDEFDRVQIVRPEQASHALPESSDPPLI